MLAFLSNLSDPHLIELTWTAIAILGLIVSSYNLWESIKDYRAIIAARIINGRRYFTKIVLFSEIARVLIQIIFVFLGFWTYFFLPIFSSPFPIPENITLFNYFFEYGLLISATLIVLNSVLAFFSRKKLIEELPLIIKDE